MNAPPLEKTPPVEDSNEVLLHLAYAEASVLLLECVMGMLVEKRVVTVSELVEEVETAISTKRAMVHDNRHPEVARLAAGVLARIANSLAATNPVSER
jgi:NifB/MoaA-like Fe-S oxidoreductase